MDAFNDGHPPDNDSSQWWPLLWGESPLSRSMLRCQNAGNDISPWNVWPIQVPLDLKYTQTVFNLASKLNITRFLGFDQLFLLKETERVANIHQNVLRVSQKYDGFWLYSKLLTIVRFKIMHLRRIEVTAISTQFRIQTEITNKLRHHARLLSLVYSSQLGIKLSHLNSSKLRNHHHQWNTSLTCQEGKRNSN